MKLKKLLVVAVAAAFGLPFTAQVSAAGDSIILAADGPAGASSTGTGPTGGVPSTQSAGEPKAPMAGERSAAGGTAASTSMSAPDFSALDKNGDGNISRAEWDAYFRSGSAASGGATTSPASPSGAVVTPGGSGKTGTTAGPGESSPSTAPGSASATKPDTSGTGKAQ